MARQLKNFGQIKISVSRDEEMPESNNEEYRSFSHYGGDRLRSLDCGGRSRGKQYAYELLSMIRLVIIDVMRIKSKHLEASIQCS